MLMMYVKTVAAPELIESSEIKATRTSLSQRPLGTRMPKKSSVASWRETVAWSLATSQLFFRPVVSPFHSPLGHVSSSNLSKLPPEWTSPVTPPFSMWHKTGFRRNSSFCNGLFHSLPSLDSLVNNTRAACPAILKDSVAATASQLSVTTTHNKRRLQRSRRCHHLSRLHQISKMSRKYVWKRCQRNPKSLENRCEGHRTLATWS